MQTLAELYSFSCAHDAAPSVSSATAQYQLWISVCELDPLQSYICATLNIFIEFCIALIKDAAMMNLGAQLPPVCIIHRTH